MSIDFFDQQEHARRRTGRLVILFALAVVGIVAAVYGVATIAFELAASKTHNVVAVMDGPRLLTVTTVVLLIITSGSLFKILMLRDGGESIATMLGGHLLDPQRAGLAERRLLNVVEEMALASGTPVPPVYVLDDEPGINAFAAGFTPGDAVIGVSRGALETLTRDEMQGVIGHEFSHILNGDMRLNLRMIGLIHGILIIALIGQLVIRGVLEGWGRSSSRDDKGGGMALMLALIACGAAVWLIGSVGVLFGRLIKAAVSRQREYLADASSVQFTRNPEGLAGALKKIGGLTAGSLIRNHNAEQACHMFFGQGVSFAGLLATHPPLIDRIKRLEPNFDGNFGTTAPAAEDEADEPRIAGLAGRPRPTAQPVRPAPPERDTIAIDGAAAVAAVGRPSQAHFDFASDLLGSLPAVLVAALEEPFTARAVVYALLLDPDQTLRQAQLRGLEAKDEPGTVVEVLRLLPATRQVGKAARVPLVDLALPTLRRLSPKQYSRFRESVQLLVQSDGRVSLFEYALQRMLLRYLDRVFAGTRPPAPRFAALSPLVDDCDVLLATLAWLGTGQEAEARRAYTAGLARLGLPAAEVPKHGLPPAGQHSLEQVDDALGRLAQGVPALRRRVLDACATCIACDGVITVAEAELLRAIADALDCPMPPLAAHAATATDPRELAGRVNG